MEQKEINDHLPNLFSHHHPLLICQNLEQHGDQFFYTVDDPESHYRCRIPQLVGKRIRGCFHGWIILTNHPHDFHWSLWNPVTTKFIRLPRLKLKEKYYDDIHECCLTSPPDVPGSILLLTRVSRDHIVYCRMDRKRKKLRWCEMSYREQFLSMVGEIGLLFRPVCCNNKVYARILVLSQSELVVQVDIMAKEKEDVISLVPLIDMPKSNTYASMVHAELKSSCEELFTVVVGMRNGEPFDVYMYKLDMSSMKWIEINDVNNNAFFVDMHPISPIHSSPSIVSESGGYVHIIHETGKVIYSYNIKHKTFSLSSMHNIDVPTRKDVSPRSKMKKILNIPICISIWGMHEFRLQAGDKHKCEDDPNEVQGSGDELMLVRPAMNDKVEPKNKSFILDTKIDVLETIMKFCVGIEYLKFRATCKLCRLVAPLIQFNDNRKLQTYSLDSPWLIVFDKEEDIITFMNPIFGNENYFIKPPPQLFYDYKILCSKYGWLLLFIDKQCPAFFNPFTNDILKLPPLGHFQIICFSAPPTSSDCMVVAFSHFDDNLSLHVHYVGREQSWRQYDVNFGDGKAEFLGFPISYGQNVYSLSMGGLQVLKEIDSRENLSRETVEYGVDTPKVCSKEYFQVKCDRHHLLVIVGEFGEYVKVFKLNVTTKKWEKVKSLGRHMIFISDTTCLCMDAKTPKMENKIYFPRWHCDNKRIVFYSLETCKYHTFNDKDIKQNIPNFFGTQKKIGYTYAWIEPTWS